jgi:hypothetical protein
MVFPWPPRHERKAAIAQAARNKDRAQAAAAKARSVEAQIVRMTEENHLAAGIAAQIWRKGR